MIHPDRPEHQQPDPKGYTILSAVYSNAEGTAMTLLTEEHGAVSISQEDAPALWAIAKKGPVAEYTKAAKGT